MLLKPSLIPRRKLIHNNTPSNGKQRDCAANFSSHKFRRRFCYLNVQKQCNHRITTNIYKFTGDEEYRFVVQNHSIGFMCVPWPFDCLSDALELRHVQNWIYHRNILQSLLTVRSKGRSSRKLTAFGAAVSAKSAFVWDIQLPWDAHANPETHGDFQ